MFHVSSLFMLYQSLIKGMFCMPAVPITSVFTCSWTNCIQGEVCREFSSSWPSIVTENTTPITAHTLMVFSSPTLHVIAAVKYNYCLHKFLTLGAIMRAMAWCRVRKWEEQFWNFLKALLINLSTLKI